MKRNTLGTCYAQIWKKKTPHRLYKYPVHTKNKKGKKKIDLTHLMSDMKFDHIGLAETIRNWHSLQEEDRTPKGSGGTLWANNFTQSRPLINMTPFLAPLIIGKQPPFPETWRTGKHIQEEKLPALEYGVGRYLGDKVMPPSEYPPSTGLSLHIREEAWDLSNQNTPYSPTKKNIRIFQRQGFMYDIKEEIDKQKADK